MKKLLITIAAVMVAAVVAQAGPRPSFDKPACSDVGNWYVGAYGGMSAYQRTKDWDGGGSDYSQKRKIGVNGGLKVGYDFAPQNWVRPVLEFDAQYNYFRRGVCWNNTGTVTDRLDNHSFAFMVNALAKFDCGVWQPYVGAGAGVYHLRVKDTSPVGNFSPIKDSTNGFAWQLLAGTDYKLDANWALFVEYKWLNYEIRKYKDFMPGYGGGPLSNRIGQQLASLGVRYTF